MAAVEPIIPTPQPRSVRYSRYADVWSWDCERTQVEISRYRGKTFMSGTKFAAAAGMTAGQLSYFTTGCGTIEGGRSRAYKAAREYFGGCIGRKERTPRVFYTATKSKKV
jgi:hypothetical protein